MVLTWCILILTLIDFSSGIKKNKNDPMCIYTYGEKFIAYNSNRTYINESYMDFNHTLEFCQDYTCYTRFIAKSFVQCFLREKKFWCPLKTFGSNYLIRLKRKRSTGESFITSPKMMPKKCHCDIETFRPVMHINRKNRKLTYRYNLTSFVINQSKLRSKVMHKEIGQKEFVTVDHCLNGAPLQRGKTDWECQLKLNPCKLYTVCVETKVDLCKEDLKCIDIKSYGLTESPSEAIKPHNVKCMQRNGHVSIFWRNGKILNASYEYRLKDKNGIVLLEGKTNKNNFNIFQTGSKGFSFYLKTCKDCNCRENTQLCTQTVITGKFTSAKRDTLNISFIVLCVILLLLILFIFYHLKKKCWKTEDINSKKESEEAKV
ncbi:uncharacterized protein LOC130657150 [Hydractinia symbiolongicarpus]|uniref:uncharacterized protein LOC130657150 n=1 Tax=Hydractinia symbiolongicarpus TaxID=13093 RepID=UPI00254B3493|nr:uncharacterized protein LOC130657150 [Hydractinia symbiolongicarpus]XP_057316098.1 uncharacterized protein LOC130657150 [Hydractinia symbiolongicarpus]